jgi:formylglycine-generating enzyme required for sulfatase activity
MGSPEGEEGRYFWEGPQHAVHIKQGYWLFDTPCTTELWGALGYPGIFEAPTEGPTRPVEEVSWTDIERFLAALNERVPGLDLCLPSEAQWEYACRSGSTTRWCFGDDETGLGEYAWYGENPLRETHPVGQKRPNAWGLYDCHGNVYEWVRDAWHDGYEGAPTTGASWETSEASADRVIRGGSCYGTARVCRSAFRSRRGPDDRNFLLGFRCARVQERALGSGSGEEERSDRPRPAPAGGHGSCRDVAGAYREGGGTDDQLPGNTPPKALPATGTTLRFQADECSRIALPDAPALVLRTDRDELTLHRVSKPGWADAMGRDRFGLWAEIRIESSDSAPVIQRLRWIPPGRFEMGSPDDEPGHGDWEGPRHPVIIGQGYWLFDTPCTQALWEAVIGEHKSRFRDLRRPVENVRWEDAQRFTRVLQHRLAGLDNDGGRIALPSEAQWEYACRAGSDTALYTGPIEIKGDENSMDAPALDAIAWYGGNSGLGYDLDEGDDSTKGDWWEGQQKQYPHTKAGTRRVKGKQPNAWGLYDTLGNVWEWTEDHWHEGYERIVPLGDGIEEVKGAAPTSGWLMEGRSDGSAWIDGDAPPGAGRVIRGGSWYNPARLCRSACRGYAHPDYRNYNLGFRCARVQA